MTIHAQSLQRALRVEPERGHVTSGRPLTLSVVLDPARAELTPGRSYEGEIAIEFGHARETISVSFEVETLEPSLIVTPRTIDFGSIHVGWLERSGRRIFSASTLKLTAPTTPSVCS